MIFFLGFEQLADQSHLAIQFEARVTEYCSLAINLIFMFGIAFQLPLILVLLMMLKLVAASDLAKYRRHAIVGIFIVAAVITPPDVISQIGMAIPLMILYELAIIIGKKIVTSAPISSNEI